jgi:hypothetical protein
MSAEEKERLTEPILNASRPGTLAGLSLTVLRFSAGDPLMLRAILSMGSIMFLLSSFLIFFYTIYPSRRVLWMGTAATFLVGLFCSVISSIFLILV